MIHFSNIKSYQRGFIKFTITRFGVKNAVLPSCNCWSRITNIT